MHAHNRCRMTSNYNNIELLLVSAYSPTLTPDYQNSHLNQEGTLCMIPKPTTLPKTN